MFKGLEKNSLMDYPGLVSSIVFLPGCNMRCPYCHNPQLINSPELLPDVGPEEVLKFLKSRKKWVDALVITGGEPTIYKELPAFIKQVKALGLKVKLDTNATNQVMIKELINSKLVDYFAIDVKASEKNYGKACGLVKVDLKKINESIKLVISSGINYELRTTVVPGIHSKSDLVNIGKWFKGASKFIIQQFRGEFPMLDKKYQGKKTFTLTELESFKEALLPYFNEVLIRGH